MPFYGKTANIQFIIRPARDYFFLISFNIQMRHHEMLLLSPAPSHKKKEKMMLK
jgi:hypothetical protein